MTTKSMKKQFDRTREDVGNILLMEHVNVTVLDQALATTFYVNGLGLTRDPYMDFGPGNVWVNAGSQQFHLPTRSPQVLRGEIGLVVPDLKSLAQRLKGISRLMQGTCFDFKEKQDCVQVTCPYGNRIRCFGSGAFGTMHLGIPYVELDVPPGTAAGIARFYSKVMGTPASTSRGLCTVSIGTNQTLRYKETKKKLPDYDGHHIAVYVSDFSGPHKLLDQQGLITEESDAHQYRFTELFDPDNGRIMFELEHEVRSLNHPMYARPLTNRNASQTFATYVRGHDAFIP